MNNASSKTSLINTQIPLECVSGRDAHTLALERLTVQRSHAEPAQTSSLKNQKNGLPIKARFSPRGSGISGTPVAQTTTPTFTQQTRRIENWLNRHTLNAHPADNPLYFTDHQRAILEWNRGGELTSDLIYSICKKPKWWTDSNNGHKCRFQSSTLEGRGSCTYLFSQTNTGRSRPERWPASLMFCDSSGDRLFASVLLQIRSSR